MRKLRATGKVVEPLADFHKDEVDQVKRFPLPQSELILLSLQVRKLGQQLGLPASLVQRHPFPGPGLAIRILCQKEPYAEKDYSETQVSRF